MLELALDFVSAVLCISAVHFGFVFNEQQQQQNISKHAVYIVAPQFVNKNYININK